MRAGEAAGRRAARWQRGLLERLGGGAARLCGPRPLGRWRGHGGEAAAEARKRTVSWNDAGLAEPSSSDSDREREGRCAEGCPGSGRPCARTPAKSSKRSAFREKRPCLSFVTTVSDSSSLSPEATAATQFDGDKITRISMRLDGMDHWSLLAALVTGFSMQLISSVTLSDFTESSLLLPQVLFVFFGMVATISAFYATMVFGLCNLYGRTALGLQKDTGYLRFITNTAVFRENAFVALLTSIASIIATISFMLFLKTPFSTALVSCLGALLACSKASLHMSSIMSSATKEIYT